MNARQKVNFRCMSVLCVAVVAGTTMIAGLSPVSAQESRTGISALPYTINQPGSYYLTKNLSGAAGQDGITVNADDVTIDLNGFTLKGAAGGDNDGIVLKDHSNVEIRNGSIRSWPGAGIFGGSGDSAGNRVIDVRVNLCLFGVMLYGSGHVIDRCTIEFNGIALDIGSACKVTGNVSAWNLTDGINTGPGCSVLDNTVYGNMAGIVVMGKGTTVKGNTVRLNDMRGIDVDGTDNMIEANFVTSSTTGIYFGEVGNFYANNRTADCTTGFGGNVPTGSGDGGGNRSF